MRLPVRRERSPKRGLGRWGQKTNKRQDARLVSVTLFGEGKRFICEWGRWVRFDEALDDLPGRWSVGRTSQRVVLVCLDDDRVRLDVVTSFDEATARGWPASLWDGVERPVAPDGLRPVPPAMPLEPEPVRYLMPALRVIDDDRGAEAVETVQRLGQASTSLLQRELSIGHVRAGRIIDLMERAGIVGPPGPRGVREVYAQERAAAESA